MDLLLPTSIGQVVKAKGYGGKVRLWMTEGTGIVVRFTSQGNAVVEVKTPGYATVTVTDRLGCFRQWDAIEGKWVR